MLSTEQAKETDSQLLNLDEPGFRYLHNEDEMAVNKLSEVRGDPASTFIV
jgi:hypothetical protein